MTRNKLAILLGVAVLAAVPARAQFEVKSADGKSAIKFGLLAQLQAESIDTADGEDASKNLFIRRLRLLTGGKFGDKVTFFVETDSPNLLKADATGKKNDAQMFLQDVIVTYTVSPALNIDGGLLLIPQSHNSEQGATTLLPVDYGPYSFLASGPTGSRVGRDTGLQLRGYLGNNHFEYRAGVFQGARGTDSTAPFRYVGRVVWYPFDAENTFFYSGTYQGKKKVLALGASYDKQDDYKTSAFDVFFDWPIGQDVLTAQTDYIVYDGGTWLTSLPKQKTTLFEASYHFGALKLGPYVQYSQRNYDATATPDEKITQVGLIYWASGHQMNVKAAWSKLEKDNAPDRNQLVVQWQLFLY